MWNTVFREHQFQHPDCQGFLSWDLKHEEKRGLVWRERAICSTCNYTSNMFELYEEMPRRGSGRKPACVNNVIQIGHSQTSIGNEGLRTIRLSANIPAPSTKGMQKSSNTVCQNIECTNMRDMAEHRKDVKEFNSMIGNKTDIIDIQCDSTYNNAIYSGVGRTPFQPATQCTHILVEDTTPEKKVIHITTKNKLCTLGKMHASDEEAKLCQCSANISLQTNVGDEYTFCKEELIHLKKTDNLEVRNMTTDPDTASYQASLDLRREGITETVPVNHIDTCHLAQNHRKFIKGQSKLIDLMPGRTKTL